MSLSSAYPGQLYPGGEWIAATGLPDLTVNVSDDTTTSDAVSGIQVSVQRSVADTATTADSVVLGVQYNVNVSDSTTTADSIGAARVYNVSVSDAASVTEPDANGQPNASFEDGTFFSRYASDSGNTGGVTQSQAVAAQDGSFVAAVTNVTAGTLAGMDAYVSTSSSQFWPYVNPGQGYTFSIWVQAATAGRLSRPTIEWYTAGAPGTLISTVPAANVTDVVGSWIQLSVTGIAPATAFHALLAVTWINVPVGEVHYTDAWVFSPAPAYASITPGPVASDSASGVDSSKANESTSIAVADDTTTSDSASGTTSFGLSVSDNSVTSDSDSVQVLVTRAVVDSVTTADSSQLDVVSFVSASESATTTDSVSVSVGSVSAATVSVSDAVSVADQVSVQTIRLVGALGAFVTGASGGSLTPSYGAGASPTAGDLLILWAAGEGHSNTLSITGWTLTSVEAQGTPFFASIQILYRIATGSDPAPTLPAVAGLAWSAQLGTFATAGQVSPLDAYGQNFTAVGGSSTTSLTTTASTVDTYAQNLVVYGSMMALSSNQAVPITSTLNNGATANDTNDDASASTNRHVNFGWGITTGNGVADAETMSWSSNASFTGAMGVITTFAPPPLSPQMWSTVSDSATTADTATVLVSTPTVRTSDSVATSDSVSETVVSRISVVETSVTSDLANETLVSLVSTLDPATTLDTASEYVPVNLSLADSTITADSGSAGTTAVSNATGSDTVTTGDTATAAIGIFTTEADSATVGEASNVEVISFINVAEDTTTTDSDTVVSLLGTVRISETVATTDSNTTQVIVSTSVAEIVASGDNSVSYAVVSYSLPADVATMSESVEVRIPGTPPAVAGFETVTAGDSAFAVPIVKLSGSDSVSISETVNLTRVSLGAVKDSTTTTDVAAAAALVSSTISDAIVTFDASLVAPVYSQSAVDSTTTADSVAVFIFTPPVLISIAVNESMTAHDLGVAAIFVPFIPPYNPPAPKPVITSSGTTSSSTSPLKSAYVGGSNPAPNAMVSGNSQQKTGSTGSTNEPVRGTTGSGT